jgi:putative hydrolase of the HAD superfamily
LDAYRTVLAMDRPFQRLHENLASVGIEVAVALAEEAMTAEMHYYRDHHLEGRDEESVADLRVRCAGVLFQYLAEHGAVFSTPVADQVDVLLRSVRFFLYDDVLPAIAWCKSRKIRVAMLSNWDSTLPGHLADIGLAGHYELAVVSASVGAEKPDPRIFQHALDELGVGPDELVHVGDEYESDILGAQAVGVNAVLIDRAGIQTGVSCRRISTLSELPGVVEDMATD